MYKSNGSAKPIGKIVSKSPVNFETTIAKIRTQFLSKLKQEN